MVSLWFVRLLCSLCILCVVDARPQKKRHGGPSLYDDIQGDYNSFHHHRDISSRISLTEKTVGAQRRESDTKHIAQDAPDKPMDERTGQGVSDSDQMDASPAFIPETVVNKKSKLTAPTHPARYDSRIKDKQDENDDTPDMIQEIATPLVKENPISLKDDSPVEDMPEVPRQEHLSQTSGVVIQNNTQNIDREVKKNMDSSPVRESKWTAQMQKYIDEVYGGKLPYSDSVDESEDRNLIIETNKEPPRSTDGHPGKGVPVVDSTTSQAFPAPDVVLTEKPQFRLTLDDVESSNEQDKSQQKVQADDTVSEDKSDEDDDELYDDDEDEDDKSEYVQTDDIVTAAGFVADRHPKQQYETEKDRDRLDIKDNTELLKTQGNDENTPTDSAKDRSREPKSDTIKGDDGDLVGKKKSLDKLHNQMEDTEKDGNSEPKRDSLDDLHSVIKQETFSQLKPKEDSLDIMHSHMYSKGVIATESVTHKPNSVATEIPSTKEKSKTDRSQIFPTGGPEINDKQEASNPRINEVPVLMMTEPKPSINPSNADDVSTISFNKSNNSGVDDLNQRVNHGDTSRMVLTQFQEGGEVVADGVVGRKDEHLPDDTERRTDKIESVVHLMDPKPKKYTLRNKNKFETKSRNEMSKKNDEGKDAPVKTTVFSTLPNPPTTKPTKVTPNSTGGKESKAKFIISKPYETCRGNGWCPAGRMCHEGVCVCGDESFCARHRHPVCGSDGALYTSHCELHRTACVTRKHIRIDNEAKCRTQPQKHQQNHTASEIANAAGSSTILGSLCEFTVRPETAGVLWGQQVMTAKAGTLDDCRDMCEMADRGCVGFEFSEVDKYCGLYDNADDIIFWPNNKMTFYEKKRCKEIIPEVSDCGYEKVQLNSEPIFGMCDMTVQMYSDFALCEAACQGCKAFTYKSFGGVCEIFYNDLCVDMLNKQGQIHYVRHCHNDGKSCRILEVIPGRSPYMCSKATSSVSSLIECHDTCIRGHCQAFRFRNDGSGFCEIFFDKSCITMLEKGKDNYYVRRCANPEDCQYEEVASGASAPCEIVSSNTDTFEKCREACKECVAFKYLYESGECSLYQQMSCITKKNINYIKRDCHHPPESKTVTTNTVNQVISATSAPYHQLEGLKREPKVSADYKDSDDSHGSADSKAADDRQILGIKQTEIVGGESVMDPGAKEVKKDGKNVALGSSIQQDAATQNAERHSSYQQDVVPDSSNQQDVVPDSSSQQDVVPDSSNKQYVVPDSSNKQDVVPDSSSQQHVVPDSSSQQDAVPDSSIQQGDPDAVPLEEKPADSMYEKICTLQEYIRMKADILRYHCVKLGEAHCGDADIPKKGYISTLMFSFYDRNMDEGIQRDELWEIWLMENFDKMFSSCTLMDLFKFENIQDTKINKDAFMDIFNIPASALQQEIQAINTLATVGNGLEIRCGIQPSSESSQVMWRRHGVDLMEVAFPGLAVFSDGTLYLESVEIHHIGNWTCHDRDKPGVKQVHILKVHLPPIVSVAPSSQQFPQDNSDIYIHCHAEGIPTPTLDWELNGHILPDDHTHFIHTHNNGTLIIYQSDYQTDSGSYKCVGKNAAGRAEDIASIFIQKPDQSEIVYPHKSRHESFFVFHKNGFTVYEPSGCLIKRHVKEQFNNLLRMPEELDSAPSLCPAEGMCEWGQTVNVRNKFVYVSQPQQGRIIVIDAVNTYNPVEFIVTDKYPVKLYYVDHLDEVWVLCWNSEQSTGSKTVIVIREASQDIRHHIVHTQPIGYRFDLVQDLFLPPPNTLNYKYDYGYVLHTEQRGLFKLELASMRYTKAIDLAAFDCVPQHVAFVPIGGHVIVNCLQHTRGSEQVTIQILLDYITDMPLANLTLYGTPYITPDSRNVITVDKITGDVRVAEVMENGEIKKSFDVTTGSRISDVTFLSSDLGPGYDAYLTSSETSELFSINLSNGKVTTIKDASEPRQTKVSPYSAAIRSIVSGDVFSDFVASPGKSSLMIFNGKHSDIHCQFFNMVAPDTVIHTVEKSR